MVLKLLKQIEIGFKKILMRIKVLLFDDINRLYYAVYTLWYLELKCNAIQKSTTLTFNKKNACLQILKYSNFVMYI